MLIDKISLKSISVIINTIEKFDNNCNRILEVIPGEIEKQQVDEGHYKVIVRNISNSIAALVVECMHSKIMALSFTGLMDITAKELVDAFKFYREGYSLYDDLYFYFFNEDKQNGNCVISFFEPSHCPVLVEKSTEKLSNIIISW